MKYLLILALVFSSQSMAGIILSSPATQIEVGDNFTIGVSFEHAVGAAYSEILGFDFGYDFSNDIANFTSLTLAEPFNSNGDWGLDDFGDYAFAGNYATAASIDPFDQSKSVWSILTFDFTAQQVGNFELSIFDMFVTDEMFDSLAIDANSIVVSVTERSVLVSEPASLFMLLIAGLCLFIRQKKAWK